jgi:hypothetical protein
MDISSATAAIISRTMKSFFEKKILIFFQTKSTNSSPNNNNNNNNNRTSNESVDNQEDKMKKLDLVKTLLLSCDGWVTIEDLVKVILQFFCFKSCLLL